MTKINSQETAFIYLKFDQLQSTENFIDNETLHTIQKNIKEYIQNSLLELQIPFTNIKQLNSEDFVITTKKSIVVKNKNLFISKLRNFQTLVKEKLFNMEQLIHFQVFLLISITYSGEHRFESAKIGIKKLLRSKNDFIVANNLFMKQKEKISKNIKILNTVKEAIKNSSVIVYLQPIIDNKTKKTVKYESLLRIKDQQNNILLPKEFLNIAKRGKCYHQLTQNVLERSFLLVERYDKKISINLSVKDMESQQIKKDIYQLLKRYKKHTHKITFELLEDERISDLKGVMTFLNRVKDYGVKIAIDDFGKGFSNFERILYYKPDIIKIDGLLIKDIDKNDYAYSIVKTIVNFAKEQGILTVAEFVENEKIYGCVKKMGVDFSQGFYFGKPALLTKG